MNTQHIRSKDWREFCDKFTEYNRGSLLSIDAIGADGIRGELFRDLPLDKMTFDKTDACNDIISISLVSRADQRKENHLVIEPVDMQIKQSKEGNKVLQIRAENGTTLVTFHSGRFPDMSLGHEQRIADSFVKT
jgi:hypothetical protein